MIPTEVEKQQVDAGSDGEEEMPQDQVKSKKGESNAMEKLTNLVEEKQMDENKMKAAFQALHKQEEADKEAERLLEKRLAAVKISKDDVSLVVQEMKISTHQADRKLREADGDIVKCLCNLVSA